MPPYWKGDALSIMENTILRVSNVSKLYPGVRALNDVSLDIKRGEVRAIIGENGAGKSTLVKCIMGVEKPQAGSIKLQYHGNWVTPKNAVEAKAYGMHANYQHVNIAKELSVAENYFLGKMPLRLGLVDWKKVHQESKKIIDRFSLGIDSRARICDLPIAMQAMITISKISVNDELNLVIFDEPTALLENDKVEILYNYIRELKANNVSVIYISHRLEEIMDICDSVTVLKDGAFVTTMDVRDVDKDMLISLMVGRDIHNIYDITHINPGQELIRVENLGKGKCFKDISFSLRSGEILGFFGLIGSGRTEVMRSIFGADPYTSGQVYVKDKPVQIRTPLEAMHQGIGLLPENRHEGGLALELSVKENINMGSFDLISKYSVINLKKETLRAEEYIRNMRIKTPSDTQQVKNLSGGNQQKVVISKLLCRSPEVLIFDEATVGIDVGAKDEIYKLIEKLSSQGKGIILISSYLPEVMGLADRMIIMYKGQIVKELDSQSIRQMEEKDILKIASNYT